MRRRVWLVLVAAVAVLGVFAWPRRSDREPVGGAPPASTTAGPGRAAPSGLRAATVPVDAGVAPIELSKAGRHLASFAWGSGPQQLGRDRPAEGNPEAPMSLTVDSKGRTWVLDQVNKRLVRVDREGRTLSSVELPVQAGQDVAVARDGTTVVMDRLVDKSVALIDPDGKPRGELPVVGRGLKEGGAATGVFSVNGSVYVERAHGDSIRLGDTSGARDDARPEVPGRPTRDGLAYLTASIVTRSAGEVLLTVIDAATRAHRFTRQYTLPGGVRALTLLDADLHGVVYVGAALETEPVVVVICVDGRDGHPLGQARVPANVSADETFREFAVTDDGQIMALLRSEDGAELRSFSCGGP